MNTTKRRLFHLTPFNEKIIEEVTASKHIFGLKTKILIFGRTLNWYV
jgi:hypothetical protein